MKIKELIEYLQTLDDNLEVWVCDSDYPPEILETDHFFKEESEKGKIFIA
jgi:hypothetical protein